MSQRFVLQASLKKLDIISQTKSENKAGGRDAGEMCLDTFQRSCDAVSLTTYPDNYFIL